MATKVKGVGREVNIVDAPGKASSSTKFITVKHVW
jgi:hypothetical protein